MQVTSKKSDNLTEQLNIKIGPADYKEKIEQKLKDYRKNIEMPGFRKGKVPMSLVRKQYERALIADEVNNMLQNKINEYIQENKLPILGYPIPSKDQKEIDWENTDEFDFHYEIGIAPNVDIDLEKIKGIKSYKITASDEMIDKEVKKIQEQYGSFSDLEKVKKDAFVLGKFINEEENINSQSTLRWDDLTAKAQKALKGKQKGDKVELPAGDWFKDPHTLMHALNIPHEKVHGFNAPLSFDIEGVFELKPAEINKELLDKVFGEGKIENEEGLRKFIKEDIEKQLEQTADNQLLNDVTEKLFDTVEVELPADFLKRWIEIDSKGEITGDKAEEEYKKAEKGLKYQLIEESIAKKYGIKVTYDELVNLVKDLLKLQMIQYGQALPDEEQMNQIAANVLQNEEEVKRLTDQIVKKKLVNLYKEKVPVKEVEMTYDQFLDKDNK
jgi:trigger factor